MMLNIDFCHLWVTVQNRSTRVSTDILILVLHLIAKFLTTIFHEIIHKNDERVHMYKKYTDSLQYLFIKGGRQFYHYHYH